MLLAHLGDSGGRRQLRVVGGKKVRPGCVSGRKLQKSLSPLSLNSSIIRKGEGVGTL